MRVFLATWLTDHSLGQSLTKNGAAGRLLSYHFLREQKVTDKQLQIYIRKGNVDIRKKK